MRGLKNKSKALIILDLIFYSLSLLLTLYFRFGDSFENSLELHIKDFSIVIFCWLILNYIEGLYSLRSMSKDGLIVSIIRSQLINIIFGFGYFYLNPFTNITPKTNILIIVSIAMFFLYLVRRLYFLNKKKNLINVLILGEGTEVEEVKDFANEKPFLGYRVSNTTSINNITLSDYDLFVVENNFDQRELCEVLDQSFQNKEIVNHSRFCEDIIGKVPVSSLDESWFYNNEVGKRDYLYEVIKFLFDRFIALLLIMITIPIYMILFPFLLITSGRPFFYSQIRTGYKNRPFRIYKLRTMKTDAEVAGAKWATPNDDRVTPMGRFLRASRLDELPQLWNILIGDMSIIGPRPERPEIIASNLEGKIPYYKFRHLVKPGVTGWAQVNYGYGYSDNDSFIKLQYDLYYIKNKSAWLDFRILLKTIKTVVTGVGH
ncbi:exopolysaccharide biosynthesis polyprenyl glycosylphosphotransferase [Acetoanaerobium sticklandii]|uniref:exopolysaccharide biosynthesis polyprenyl glycosylphosphotransferase n=1 Tax=Acetoanaerobium sticklandii TaxID=1511 RepID=UPI003A93ACEC